MLGKRLAVGLMVGAGLFVGAATLRADDTIVLKRVKGDVPAQQLQRDHGDAEIVDVHRYGGGWRGGYGGHYGGYGHGYYSGYGHGYYGGYGHGYYGGYGHGYYGYRPYYGSYYRSGYYSGVSIGLYASPYYVPSYYYPSYYSYPTYYSASPVYPTTLAVPASVSSQVFRLKLDAPAGASEVLPVGAENLPKPRLEQQTERTFPYDGTPQAPVPMPRPEPSLKAKPPADVPDDGKVVKLPAKDKFAYPAYGDTPARPAFAEDRTVVAKKPGK